MNKRKKEVDLILVDNGDPKLAIEAKWSNDFPSNSFDILQKVFPSIKKIQLVANIKRVKTLPNGLSIRSADPWPKAMDW